MDTLNETSSGTTSTHQDPLPTRDLPCLTCRKRKVRCSKTEPCSNCQRSGFECKYDDSTRLVSRRTPKSTEPLAQRVAELEELVRNLSHRPNQGKRLTYLNCRLISESNCFPMTDCGDPGRPMENLAQNILQKLQDKDDSERDVMVEGKLVFDRERSRYLHPGFWASMYDEVSEAVVVSDSWVMTTIRRSKT